jgi:hypothetical protein
MTPNLKEENTRLEDNDHDLLSLLVIIISFIMMIETA